jgi:hypothetical protein
MKVYVSKKEIKKALPIIEWRDLQYAPDFVELEAESLDPQPREAASKDCNYEIAGEVYCANPKATCPLHRKAVSPTEEQPKPDNTAERARIAHILRPPLEKKTELSFEEYPEKPKAGEICRHGVNGYDCYVCFPEKPKGIKPLNAIEFDTKEALLDLWQKQCEIIDAINLLTKSQ